MVMLDDILLKFPLFLKLEVKDGYWGARLTETVSKCAVYSLPLPYFPPVPNYRHEYSLITSKSTPIRKVEYQLRQLFYNRDILEYRLHKEWNIHTASYSVGTGKKGEGILREIMQMKGVLKLNFTCICAKEGHTSYYLLAKDQKRINHIKQKLAKDCDSISIDILSQQVQSQDILKHESCFFNKPLELMGIDDRSREIIELLMLGKTPPIEEVERRSILELIREFVKRSLKELKWEEIRRIFEFLYKKGLLKLIGSFSFLSEDFENSNRLCN